MRLPSIPHLTAAALLIIALTLPAQTAPASAPGAAQTQSVAPQPTLRATTNLVLVDVVATDRNQPVLGIDRKSFHVFEDGKEMPIASIDDHESALPVTPPAFMTTPLPANTWTNLPAYPPSRAVNVLLLDALNTPLTDQMVVRRKMIDYLATVKPGTTLAVFTLSMQLRMVTPFTTDPGALVRALKNTKANPQTSTLLNTQQDEDLNTAQLNNVQDSIAATNPGNGAPSSPVLQQITGATPVQNAVQALQQFQADQIAALFDMRMRITLDAMQQLAAYLSGIDGRKNVIWFSGAFPLVMFPDSSLFNPFENVTSYRERIQQTAEKLTAARVAVYPVDARGLIVPSEYNAANNFVDPKTFSTKIMSEEEERFNEQSTMQEVAKETGGRAYVNTNDLDKAVANAVENGSNYYTVAYAPPKEHLDGKYHKIEVRLDGEHGVELAYRHGYYAEKPGASPDRQNDSSNQFVAALAHDAPPSTEILFQARVVPAADPLFKGVSIPNPPPGQMTLKGTPHRYVIDLKLDAHSLTFNPGPDGSHRAVLELAIVAYDANGQSVNSYEHPFQLGMKDALMQKVMSSGIPLRLAFDLPAGKIGLRIGVHDLNANRAGSLEVPLQVIAP